MAHTSPSVSAPGCYHDTVSQRTVDGHISLWRGRLLRRLLLMKMVATSPNCYDILRSSTWHWLVRTYWHGRNVHMFLFHELRNLKKSGGQWSFSVASSELCAKNVSLLARLWIPTSTVMFCGGYAKMWGEAPASGEGKKCSLSPWQRLRSKWSTNPAVFGQERHGVVPHWTVLPVTSFCSKN